MKRRTRMTIGILADSHFDEASRFDECVRLHQWIAQDGARRRVDLWLHAGDIFERKSTPTERRAVAEWLTELADSAPVVIVRGNHDEVGDLPIFSRLRARHPIVVEEACGVHAMGGAVIGCMAWPRKGELLARIHQSAEAAHLGPSASREHATVAATEALRALLRGMSVQMGEHRGPRVLLAHALVTGSRVSNGQPLVGHDMELALGDLALSGADFIALGHIHKGQDWAWQFDGGTPIPIVYSGSPRRTAFGEVEPKGYVLDEFDAARGGVCHWERIQTPARPMVLCEGRFCSVEGIGAQLEWRRQGEEWAADEMTDFGDHFAGAEVRLRYDVEVDRRAAARAAAEQWKKLAIDVGGAVEVKLEEAVRPKVRARAPELAKAQALDEQLCAFWAVRRPDLQPSRRDRWLARVSELQSENK